MFVAWSGRIDADVTLDVTLDAAFKLESGFL